MSGRRAGQFRKYFALVVLPVGAGLTASGVQETRNSLVSLQREKALPAGVRIEQRLHGAGGSR